jgi:hypothetical protein
MSVLIRPQQSTSVYFWLSRGPDEPALSKEPPSAEMLSGAFPFGLTHDSKKRSAYSFVGRDDWARSLREKSQAPHASFQRFKGKE